MRGTEAVAIGLRVLSVKDASKRYRRIFTYTPPMQRLQPCAQYSSIPRSDISTREPSLVDPRHPYICIRNEKQQHAYRDYSFLPCSAIRNGPATTVIRARCPICVTSPARRTAYLLRAIRLTRRTNSPPGS